MAKHSEHDCHWEEEVRIIGSFEVVTILHGTCHSLETEFKIFFILVDQWRRTCGKSSRSYGAKTLGTE